jgi:hypothetical protein
LATQPATNPTVGGRPDTTAVPLPLAWHRRLGSYPNARAKSSVPAGLVVVGYLRLRHVVRHLRCHLLGPFGAGGDGYQQFVTQSQQPSSDDGIAPGAGAPEAQWVSVAQAAQATGTSEAWIMDRCHDGRLPNRAAGASESSGTDQMVPLATVRALVEGRISE